MRFSLLAILFAVACGNPPTLQQPVPPPQWPIGDDPSVKSPDAVDVEVEPASPDVDGAVPPSDAGNEAVPSAAPEAPDTPAEPVEVDSEPAEKPTPEPVEEPSD